MIKLIYDKLIIDVEALATTLKGLNDPEIVVLGISTLESATDPQTFVFVSDEITEEKKIIVDGKVKEANSKLPPPPSPTEPPVENIVDEPRKLT